MRTTIELKPEHRSRLIAIAAKRGKKGFSSVLNEAVESYLSEEAERDARRQRALRLRGILKHEEAAELQKNAAALRASWR
jgi:predicted transcriptional regulator